MSRALILLACIACCGCDSSDSGPPDYSPTGQGPTNPVTCDYLRDQLVPADESGHFAVDGGPAGCAPNGVECAFGTCDGGVSIAVCTWNVWLLVCGRRPEGGAPDGAKADGAQDGEADTSAE